MVHVPHLTQTVSAPCRDVTGVTLRICITFVTMMGQQYNYKELLFFATAWTPKATVQVSAESGMTQVLSQA